jgi:hypothetical protein
MVSTVLKKKKDEEKKTYPAIPPSKGRTAENVSKKKIKLVTFLKRRKENKKKMNKPTSTLKGIPPSKSRKRF